MFAQHTHHRPAVYVVLTDRLLLWFCLLLMEILLIHIFISFFSKHIYFHVIHNNNKTQQYYVLQPNGSWLHVSAALLPSSSQLVQIKCPQCAYSMGSHSVYNHDICEIKETHMWDKEPHMLWLYTLWDPVLYAHWGHLICTSWPEDGRNTAETCSQEPLSSST